MPLFKLHSARVQAGLTQKEAAAALKISKNTLVNYEKYRTTPNSETARKMADLYGLSINEMDFFAV